MSVPMLLAWGPRVEYFGPRPGLELHCLPDRWVLGYCLSTLADGEPGPAGQSALPWDSPVHPSRLGQRMPPYGSAGCPQCSVRAPGSPPPGYLDTGLSAWGSGSLHTLNPQLPFPGGAHIHDSSVPQAPPKCGPPPGIPVLGESGGQSVFSSVVPPRYCLLLLPEPLVTIKVKPTLRTQPVPPSPTAAGFTG